MSRVMAGSVTKPYTVAANSRQTISVQQEDPLLDNAAIAATVTSTNNVPILAERAIFWPAFPWYEGHASAGVTATGTRWALADGEAGGPLETQTYILIANTGSAAATVRVTLLLEDGGTLPPQDFTIRGRTAASTSTRASCSRRRWISASARWWRALARRHSRSWSSARCTPTPAA